MKTIQEFCELHAACSEGRKWALQNCKTLREAWDTAPEPGWVIWLATRPGVLTDKELRLFAVFCARQNEPLLTDERSRNAIGVAERFANGQATAGELSAAESAAWSAARSAGWSAEPSAWSAAESAARSAAESAARSARWAAAWSAQAEWLRKNCNPNFE